MKKLGAMTSGPNMYIYLACMIVVQYCFVLSHGKDELPDHTHIQYIVVGAGPAGLQMAYFLERAGRDYLVLEQGNVSGNFFTQYPRHDRLISINKRFTGKTNKEFNLRHDWNSLISDDESLQVRHYSKEIFPDRRDYVRYLKDYTEKLGLKVRYNTQVASIVPTSDTTRRFVMRNQHGHIFTCSYLILATGIATPNEVKFEGVEFTESYENIPLDPEKYDGQTVLILGRGNSAFEVADSIYGNTNLVHMLSRSRVRLSWETHYVGDLRAVNNGLLDTYQLKTLDGVVEAPVEQIAIHKGSDGKLYALDTGSSNSDEEQIDTSEEPDNSERFPDFDNFALRDGYDRIIRCLGWKFDTSIFFNSSSVSLAKGRKKKYPLIYQDYQSVDHKYLYYAGTNTHSLDFRKSAGGFIHGFRYTTQALHRTLEWRHHGVQWPSVTSQLHQLTSHILKRVNEASDIYQMFAVLGDVIALRRNNTEFEYFEAFPVNLIHRFSEYTGHDVDSVIVLVMEYGRHFSGPGKDIFREDRATGEPAEAHQSNFLHPVLYYYNKLPSATAMTARVHKTELPRPNKMHHVVEDFLTDFTAPTAHILPLRRFIEDISNTDMREVFAEDCARAALTHTTVPYRCHDYLTSSTASSATSHMLQFVQDQSLLL